MNTPIDQEIEAQINLNWIQLWRDNELTFLMTIENEEIHVVKNFTEKIYKTGFRAGINEAFRQASLAAERELENRGFK